MTPADPEDGFKVTDRRRRDSAEETAPTTPAPPTAPPRPSPPRAEPPRPSTSRTAAPAPPPAAMEGDAGEPSLEGLFMMLASSAMVALGEVGDPMTGRRLHDPAQAAEIIDLLVLLRKKTEGNRAAEETQVLEELIYDLQVRYVEAMKQPG